jgi:DNA-binding MarR family transcriptional regulator
MRNFCTQMVSRLRSASAARLRRVERGGRGGGRAAARAAPEGDTENTELSETIFALYAQGRRMNQRLAAQHGLTAQQLAALSLLAHAGPTSLGELGERMRTGASTLTGIVDRMEREDIVARERSAEDRRVWRVTLTVRGEALAAQLETTPGGVVREALAALVPAERRELGRLLGKLASAVQAAGKRAGLLGEDNDDE